MDYSERSGNNDLHKEMAELDQQLTPEQTEVIMMTQQTEYDLFTKETDPEGSLKELLSRFQNRASNRDKTI